MNSKIAVGVLIFLFGIINSFTSSRLVDAAPTDFLGTWVNVDQETRGLTALNIVLGAAGFEVQGFGQCHPTDCDWGFTALNFPDDTRGEAVWDFGFSETTLVIHLEGDQLVAETYTIFKDDSGRPNYRALYLMRRSQPDSGLVRGVVLGVDSGANDGSSTLLQISSETAAGTVIGETGFMVTDIAVTPDGRVFGITIDRLLSINPTTGIASPVGTGLGVSDANALVSDSNGALYGATVSGSFIRIDPQTGLATVIGSYGSGLASSGDLAFSPKGRLFGTVLDGGADDVLISVDLATGQATVIGRIGFPAVWGLAFASDGTLFGATNDNPPSLLVIDTATGAGTAVGTISNVNGITGLTYARFSGRPGGRAPNLIVLVHGCCTDANGVSEWGKLANKIVKKITKTKTSEAWEIVVWDWHEYTPKRDYTNPLNPGLNWLIIDANKAYDNAGDQPDQPGQGSKLADAINKYSTYKYIHLIAHSAGAKLIDKAAKTFAKDKNREGGERPFIYLTFLDAYTRTKKDSGEEGGKGYGYLENYPKEKHFAEHYVDKSPWNFADATLVSAFNFDITGWVPDKDDKPGEFGHQWPIRWYTRSVESPTRTGILGFKLSLEGGNEAFCTLTEQFSPGVSCQLTNIASEALCGNIVPITPCR